MKAHKGFFRRLFPALTIVLLIAGNVMCSFSHKKTPPLFGEAERLLTAASH